MILDTVEPAPPENASRLARVRAACARVYHGKSRRAQRFQTAIIVIDLLTIAFFVATPALRDTASFLWVDSILALILAADILARCLASRNAWHWLRRPTTLVDLAILVTLLFPYWLINFSFLRILRLWSISRSGIIWLPLKRHGLQRWEEAGRSIVNLVTFLFVATGFIYTFFFRTGSGFTGYVDALYFTVATVTTTGFGDITLPGPAGKLTSIVTMLIGISLFVRLAQSIFRPYKVDFSCPRCALSRHEPDAVHCKACGFLLKIPDHDDD
ncbi:ion transporter [Aureimonas sp. Leaf454]|uniref:potassium channel family protein n=1 Tax=Aureimonas sp. Leaf454 TaxID=1736381 RepID=UPI0006F52DB2|nr:potassium channel family protein [Aureimonas sp. Leaf454]KQT47530.1 ion transporter [Aureimonas sp. Leaf454]